MDHPAPTPLSEDILRRVTGEYLEMPGLRLKREQAQRLWGLDQQTCLRLLEALVDSGFLCKFADGQYGRRTDGAVTPPFAMAKAGLAFKTVPRRRSSDAA
jgi:hypothetical protein